MMKTVILASAFGMAAAAASAATLEFTDVVSLTTTDWTDSVSVSQFDTSLGTLTNVMISLTGAVEGEAKAESLDAAAAVVTLELSALITASTALLGDVAAVLPLVSESQSLTAFDNVIDFGGSSGFDTGTIGTSDMDMATFVGGDMSEFIGAGFATIMLSAEGDTEATGSGNLITQFGTRASAEVTVKYTYDEIAAAVPLPAGLPLLLGALGVMGWVRRKS